MLGFNTSKTTLTVIRAKAALRQIKHASVVRLAQRAPDGVAPPRPFAFAHCRIHPRLEASLTLPAGGETRHVRAQSRGTASEISSAKRGGFHDSRTIDRSGENVGHELHGDIARRHAAIDPQ